MSDFATNGSAMRRVAPERVRGTVIGLSAVGGASGSSPPYAASANAASASTPTGSDARYDERQTGRPVNDCSTSASTADWASAQVSRQVSAPSEGKTRFATTPSTR